MAIHFLRLQLILPCVGLMKKKTNQNNQIFCSILCRPDEEKTNQNNQIFCSILCWPEEKKTNQNNQIFCSILCWPEEKKHKYNLILRFFPNNFDKNPHLEEFVKVMGGAVEEDKEAAAFLNL